MATSDGQEKTAPSLSLATRLPVLSLILVFAITIPLVYLARSIHFDGSPRPLLPKSERREATGIGPDLDGEDALVIGVFADDVFRPATLAKIDDLSTNLWHLDGVATVSSPTTLLRPAKTSEGVRMVPLLGALPKTAEEAAAFRAQVLDHPLAVGNVVSADGAAAAIKVHLKLRGAGAKDRRALVEEIRERVAGAGGPERFALAGRPVQVIEAADLLRHHLLVATAAALALTAIAALLALRSLRGVLLALATACTAIAWVLGSMAAVKQPIDFCTVDLAPLFALLAAAPAMVIIARYDQERGRGATSRAAGLATMDAMRLPLILTALATLIGSGVFISSRFPALRAFSLHAGTGVAGMLAAWLLLVPAALVLLPGGATQRRSPRLLTGRLESIGGVLDRHRGVLILMGCGVLVAALFGSSRIRVQTGYLQYFQRAGTSARDAELIAEKLWGPNVISVVIDGHRQRAVLELESLRALRDLQHFIAEQPGVNATRSLIDYVELIRRSRGEPKGVLPASQEEIDSLFDLEPAALYDVANEKLSRTRIVVRTGIVDTAEMTHLLERIDAFASPKLLHRALGKRNMFPNGFLVRPMGTAVRLYEGAELLRSEAWPALGRVAAALAAVIALFFLSLRIAAVCLILGGVPVLTLVGLMGWLGMPLTHVSAVLPPLLLGIAVGHTGHYLSAFGTSTQTTAADASADVVAYLGPAAPLRRVRARHRLSSVVVRAVPAAALARPRGLSRHRARAHGERASPRDARAAAHGDHDLRPALPQDRPARGTAALHRAQAIPIEDRHADRSVGLGRTGRLHRSPRRGETRALRSDQRPRRGTHRRRRTGHRQPAARRGHRRDGPGARSATLRRRHRNREHRVPRHRRQLPRTLTPPVPAHRGGRLPQPDADLERPAREDDRASGGTDARQDAVTRKRQ